MSGLIKAAYPQDYAAFSANKGYIITWNVTAPSGQPAVYQVILATDGANSFIIVLYDQLGIGSDNTAFITDPNDNRIFFNASTTGSNCCVPGQFIFSLNTQSGKFNYIYII
jgi:hypothetical protein